MPERKLAASRTRKPPASAHSTAPRKSPDAGKEPSGTARQRILLIASTKFAQHGFEAVSTGEIARAADMSQAIIHYHFGTKEELWRESITFMMADLDQRFPLHMSELRDLDPLMRLKVMIRRFIALSAYQPNLARILVHETLAESPRLKWLVDTFVRARLLALDDTLRQANATGTTKLIPTYIATNAIVNACSFIFSLAPLIRMVHNVEVQTDQAVAEISDNLLEMLLHGLSQK
ncbi:TetR/AcrR family transcriptional regulator [Variovorax fucosicus]|uniref:TetR/AcrR family transcriptional regulator n=1 Tax=Variovorax fucosicus TaxID=3053517 RepID=UPI002578294C|nr:TetR/AcrR family transcriptional regulator [Variovorax sp. J22G47]MDM0058849.1 TetR/AcrR family transcriptional regulator [Variovorax sp. J22G47]